MKKLIWLLVLTALMMTGPGYSQTRVELPDTSGTSRETMLIPVIVELEDNAIACYDFEIVFDSQIVQITGISSIGTLTEQWPIPAMNSTINGKFIAGGYNLADSVRGEGVLLNLICILSGDVGDSSELKFAYFKFHGDHPAVTTTDGLIRIVNSETQVDIINSLSFPAAVVLKSNYPDPFYSKTMLNFELNKPQHVKIEIFDILGRKVKTLHNEFYPAGSHQIFWDGNGISGERRTSGVYFCVLKTDRIRIVEKLTLIN